VVFIAQATNTPLSLGDLLLVLGVSLITSKGAHGVPGSAIVILAAALHKKTRRAWAADGFWAEQLTLNKTPRFTGPLNRVPDFLSTGGSAQGAVDTAKPALRTV
jgi:hypothetical protein